MKNIRKTIVTVLLLALLGTILPAVSLPTSVDAASAPNLLAGTLATFEQSSVPSGWFAFGGGTVSTSTTVAHSGSYSLKLSGRTQSWYSPAINIYDLMKTNGAGTYYISIWVYVDALTTSPSQGAMLIRGTSADDNSFIDNYSGNYYGRLVPSTNISTSVNTWTLYTGYVNVLASDLTRETGTFNLMIDNLPGGTSQNLYFDDVQIYKPTEIAEQWKMKELSFTSSYTSSELVTGVQSTFEQATVPTGWSAFGGGTLSTSTTVSHSGSYSLKLAGRTGTWYSPTFNIYDLVKTNGAGVYTATVWVYADTFSGDSSTGSLLIRGGSSADDNSFIDNYSGNYYGIMASNIKTFIRSWTLYTATFTVLDSDLSRASGTFNVMIDGLTAATGQNLYFDDFSLRKEMSNRMTSTTSSFESATVPTGWSAPYGGTLSTSTTVAHNGTYSAKLADRTQAWYSPSYNIYSTLKNGGAGHYVIKFWLYVDTQTTSPSNVRMLVRGADSSDANSFIVSQAGGLYFGYLTSTIPVTTGTWTQCTASLNVLASDLTRDTGTFNLCIDTLPGLTGQNLYLDDVQIYKGYASPLDDATMDVTFTGPNGTTITMPAFWDGGSTWKVRFAPTKIGLWNYTTTCSDIYNSGLHNQTGSIGCVTYSGNLSIYQHGFVKTVSNTRYFVYDDGTPFFYLGDTHWGMPTESYDSSIVAGINSHFKHIVDDRVGHGFTVYQSEPIGTPYTLHNGLNNDDLWGFYELDRRFQYIADQGLVHANAQLFFASELDSANNGSYYSTDYLQKLSRYWVARYAAYPVMWTTAQEVDNDFYGVFDISTSPWKTVFNAVHTYDPYVHPQTAHQEYTGNTKASNSAYKDLTGHSWFGAQWSPAKNASPDFSVASDFWNYSGSKPVVNYEGHYENLWTNEFGARQQGWTAYLNGMYGQGYGAQDIWLYNTTYDEASDTTTYGITVTVAMKSVTWDTSVNFNTPTQLGYMRNFFGTMNWWQLTPRFNSTTWFANNSSYYSVASNDNDVYVAYFYNTTTNTGTLKNMDSTSYTAKWFNPRTGAYTTIGTITPSGGQWTIPSKPDSNDWVLYVYH